MKSNCSLQCLLYLLISSSALDAKTLQMKYFKDCSPPETRIFNFQNLRANLSSSAVLSFDGSFEVLSNVPGRLRYRREVSRCEPRSRTYEACGTFKVPSEQDFCSMVKIKQKQALGFGFLQKARPPFDCPFKKGVYNLSRATESYAEFMKYPLEGPLWKVTLKISAREKELYCMDFAFKVVA